LARRRRSRLNSLAFAASAATRPCPTFLPLGRCALRAGRRGRSGHVRTGSSDGRHPGRHSGVGRLVDRRKAAVHRRRPGDQAALRPRPLSRGHTGHAGGAHLDEARRQGRDSPNHPAGPKFTRSRRMAGRHCSAAATDGDRGIARPATAADWSEACRGHRHGGQQVKSVQIQRRHSRPAPTERRLVRPSSRPRRDVVRTGPPVRQRLSRLSRKQARHDASAQRRPRRQGAARHNVVRAPLRRPRRGRQPRLSVIIQVAAAAHEPGSPNTISRPSHAGG
jgi:hypothetical protein